MRGREGNNLDMSMSSLMTLWMSIKVIPMRLYARRLHNLYERIGWNSKHKNPDDGTDNLRVNLNDVPLNSSLKNNPTIIFLNYLQVPIKITHQPGIHQTCTIVQIFPMICLDYFSNEIQRSPYNICSKFVPLWERLPVWHFRHGGSQSFLCPLSNSALGAASRHSSVKNTKKYMPKKCHKEVKSC